MSKLKELIKRAIMLSKIEHHQRIAIKQHELYHKYSKKANYHREIMTTYCKLGNHFLDEYYKSYPESKVSANGQTNN